jgi:hypothetical protein
MLGEKVDAPRSRGYRRTAQILSHGLEQAQRWAGQGIEGGGLDRRDLERTTVPLEWVARTLCMGGAAQAGHYVRTRPWKSVRRKIPKPLLRFIEQEANGLRMKCTIVPTDPEVIPVVVKSKSLFSYEIRDRSL